MSQTEIQLDVAESNRETLIVALGEVLWDVFPSGPRFGGAPANFACAVAGLARRHMSVEMVSAVGNDSLGNDAIESLRQQSVGTQSVARKKQPTGKVDIALDSKGVASYEFAEDCAWDNLAWSDNMAALAERADVVCFGTLAQRSETSKKTIQQFVRSTTSRCLRIFDINLRPPFHTDTVIQESLEIANTLKLNDDELPILSEMLDVQGDEQELVARIADVANLDVVALTRGENGAMIFKNGRIVDFAGVKTDIVDTVGAGDAYTAAMVVGLLNGIDIDTINREACEVAAFVCSQAGATPQMPNRFVQSRQ